VSASRRIGDRLPTISAGPFNPRPAISAPSMAVAFLPWVNWQARSGTRPRLECQFFVHGDKSAVGFSVQRASVQLPRRMAANQALGPPPTKVSLDFGFGSKCDGMIDSTVQPSAKAGRILMVFSFRNHPNRANTEISFRPCHQGNPPPVHVRSSSSCRMGHLCHGSL
jgi:hypothetical protein